MPDRFYFLLGDLFSNAVVGAAAARVVLLVVDTDWGMFIAMVVAMILGMAMAVILSLPLMRWFGAMEVMVPTMLGGMLAGMAVGMWAAMMPVGVGAGVAVGAGVGIIALLFCSYADYLLKGASTREGDAHGS